MNLLTISRRRFHFLARHADCLLFVVHEGDGVAGLVIGNHGNLRRWIDPHLVALDSNGHLTRRATHLDLLHDREVRESGCATAEDKEKRDQRTREIS